MRGAGNNYQAGGAEAVLEGRSMGFNGTGGAGGAGISSSISGYPFVMERWSWLC